MQEVGASLFLTNYLYQIPLFLVWIAGAMLAVVRWQRHPRPSLLLLIALTIFLLRGLVMPAATFAVVHSGATMARIGLTNGLLNLGSMLLATVAWVLLLAAALGWRRPA